MKLTSTSPINTSKDGAIDPSEVLNISMPKMKIIPETASPLSAVIASLLLVGGIGAYLLAL